MVSTHARPSKLRRPAPISSPTRRPTRRPAWGLVWRCAVVSLIPIAVWTCEGLLYDYVPDRAAGIVYEIRANTLTGAACLKFRGAPPPGLKDAAC